MCGEEGIIKAQDHIRNKLKDSVAGRCRATTLVTAHISSYFHDMKTAEWLPQKLCKAPPTSQTLALSASLLVQVSRQPEIPLSSNPHLEKGKFSIL